MTAAIAAVHFLAGLIVLAEALNKLERSAPLAPALSHHARIVETLKALGWVLLALGAGGAVASPLLIAIGVPPSLTATLARLESPTFAETMVLAGFATLIIRTRAKENL